MKQPTIALDADGVLLDYSLAYAGAWQRAFGSYPQEVDPQAYWPKQRWGVADLSGAALDRFRACMDETFWSTMPALDKAVDACHQLHEAGFRLVCVTALQPEFEQARLRNLRDLGFPIETVIATGSDATGGSPKARAVDQLAPVAFVDDFLPYFKGVRSGVHLALVHRGRNGTPNAGPDMALVHSQHDSLWEFSQWMLARGEFVPLRLGPNA